MDINKEVQLPVKTDGYGCYIYDDKGKVIAQVRGYGWIKTLVGDEKAHEVQKELAQWLVDRVNRITDEKPRNENND